MINVPFLTDAQSVGARFEAYNCRTSGFDYLRLGLAIGVIFWHGSVASYGTEFDKLLHQTPIGVVARTILPMFFALSGFLVAGSLLRTKSLLTFGSHRALRIFPALTVEVVLSAVLLGPLLTTVALSEYFTSTGLIRYLANAGGIISFQLPGVFKDNPVSWVNISLWTVPYELECYVVLIGAAAFGLVRRLKWFLVLFILIQLALPVIDLVHGSTKLDINRVHPRILVNCFLGGVLVHMFRDKIPFSLPLFVVMIGLSFLCAVNGMSQYFMAAPVAYATVYIGLMNIPRLPVIFDGDYSYGLYLYAFPFQQLQVYLFPDDRGWWQNMAFAIPCALAFAVFSWHVIEKPILGRRKEIVAWLEGRWARHVTPLLPKK